MTEEGTLHSFTIECIHELDAKRVEILLCEIIGQKVPRSSCRRGAA